MTGNIARDLPRYFVAYFRRIGWWMFVLIGLVITSAFLELAAIATFVPVLTGGEPPEQYKNILRTISGQQEIGLLTLLVTTAVVILIWRGIELVADLWRIKIMNQLLQTMRMGVLKQVTELDYQASLKEKSGNLSNVMGTQIQNVVSSLGPFFDGIKAAAMIVVFFTSAFLVEWRIALGWIILGLLVAPLAAPTNRLRQVLSARIAQRQGRIQDLFLQLLRNFKYLKVSKARTAVTKHVGDEVEMVRQEGFRCGLGVSGLRCSVQVGAAMTVLIAMYLMKVPLGHSAEATLMLTAIIYRGSSGVAQMYEKWVQFCAVSGSLSVMEEVEQRLEASREVLPPGDEPAFEHSIVIDDVSFRYGERTVLDGVSLQITHHETVGIAGASGAGKSTLLNLIIGLIRPTDGSVEMDALDYRELDTTQLRDLFGYVTQEPMLFNDTIRNNISLWSEDITDQQIDNAAALTGVDAIAARCESGLDAVVGEQGTQISGGERQKIALARELCRDKPILVLDEATSSLDSRSEEEINRSIHAIRGQRTIIMVAHRLSSLRECSRIFVLAEGKVAESGSWEELVGRKGGVFRKMCETQGLAA